MKLNHETESALATLGVMLAIFCGICLSMVGITIINAIIDWLK
jgi:hypothetical protein